jgi:hypothetical protein
MLGPEFSGRLFHQQHLAVDLAVNLVLHGMSLPLAVLDAIQAQETGKLPKRRR